MCCLMCSGVNSKQRLCLKRGRNHRYMLTFYLFFVLSIGKKWSSTLFLLQALRCLRGGKRVEKKADRLFAQLETVKGILERIANSQTDRLVWTKSTQIHRQSGVNDNTCCCLPRFVKLLFSVAIKGGRRLNKEKITCHHSPNIYCVFTLMFT